MVDNPATMSATVSCFSKELTVGFTSPSFRYRQSLRMPNLAEEINVDLAEALLENYLHQVSNNGFRIYYVHGNGCL